MLLVLAAARSVADSVSDGRLPALTRGGPGQIVDTRQAYEKAGVTFIPIVNYPIDWTI
jgi:hypothetical protein